MMVSGHKQAYVSVKLLSNASFLDIKIVILNIIHIYIATKCNTNIENTCVAF